MSGLLAVWAVQRRIKESGDKAEALDGFGLGELSKTGGPIYGLAILECAKQSAPGNFDAAFEALDRSRRSGWREDGKGSRRSSWAVARAGPAATLRVGWTAGQRLP